MSIPDVIPLMLDLAAAKIDYRARFQRMGASSRNLYRFFCEEGPAIAEPMLVSGLKRRQELDFEELRYRFDDFCLNENSATQIQKNSG